MIISDLNYLEAAQETVVGGIFLGASANNIASTSLYVFENLDITKKIQSSVQLTGHGATAEAEATGTGTVSQTFSFTTPNSSSSTSVSASN